MKLLLAIVNNDDSAAVANNLTAKGFIATKLSTTGGFLKAGNTTFLIGTDDEKVNDVIDIIKTFSHKRKQVVGDETEFDFTLFKSVPVEVTVGGAAIFVECAYLRREIDKLKQQIQQIFETLELHSKIFKK